MYSEVPDAHATVSSVTEAVEMLSRPPLSDKIHEIHVLGGTQVYAVSCQCVCVCVCGWVGVGVLYF